MSFERRARAVRRGAGRTAGPRAVVCVNGGTAAESPGTWSASVEWLVRAWRRPVRRSLPRGALPDQVVAAARAAASRTRAPRSRRRGSRARRRSRCSASRWAARSRCTSPPTGGPPGDRARAVALPASSTSRRSPAAASRSCTARSTAACPGPGRRARALAARLRARARARRRRRAHGHPRRDPPDRPARALGQRLLPCRGRAAGPSSSARSSSASARRPLPGDARGRHALLARLLYRLEIVGRVPPGPCVVAANHESLLDPPLLALAADQPLRFLAKEELWRTAPAPG